jgi:eukaryotic-like serine/threonine-protein kinase
MGSEDYEISVVEDDGAPPDVLGRYQLVERLGTGGMAEVWRAVAFGDGGFRRAVVVKRILPHLARDPHFVKMFLAEARLSARLSHPNIVGVHELGADESGYFIAMEFVRGRDLQQLMRRAIQAGALEPGIAAQVLHETVRGLAYAHELNDEQGTPLRIIHRDVSPSNIMISFDGAVKLLDFGIAKALAEASDEHTKTGTLKGKYGYMSPEQLAARDLDHRIDVFAAGVVLWEALAGRRLFKGRTDLETLTAVRRARVPPPSQLNPSVPKRLDRIALRATSRDRDARYATCAEMADDLSAVATELGWNGSRLARLMRELFPHEEEASRTAIVVPRRRAPTVEGPAVQPRSPSGGHPVTAPRARLRAGTLGVALVAVTLLFGAGVQRRPAPSVAPVAAAEPDPTPPTITLEVTSTPTGAALYLEGEQRGETPVWITLPRGSAPSELRLVRPGYADTLSTVIPDRDVRLVLSMPALPPPTPRRAPVLHRAAKRSAPLVRGGFLDPYAR